MYWKAAEAIATLQRELSEARALLIDCVSVITEYRGNLVRSYATPPDIGKAYDIETIDERLVYDDVKAMDTLLSALHIAADRGAPPKSEDATNG
jgi:hypothetical protein